MIYKYITIHILIVGAAVVYGLRHVKPGPLFKPTKGEVWPKTQKEIKEVTYYTYEPAHFKMSVMNYNCDILARAVRRYAEAGRRLHKLRKRADSESKAHLPIHKTRIDFVYPLGEAYQGYILELKVNLTAPCQVLPFFEMDESYTLDVAKTSILRSSSLWGILRGLESFIQLLYFSDDYNEVHINATSILDYPSYPYRGLLLDTSRHYISVKNILNTLDAMAINKMNVFHWHIVDDQSFPYQSVLHPELSGKGAYNDTLVYTIEEVESIVEYARYRGIRVIPEFGVPGHTRSWGNSHPEILTKCCKGGKVVGLGPMNPINNATFHLLRGLFEEVQKSFPDKFFHLGGAAVDLDCWESNPKLKEYMRKNSLSPNGLYALFMNKTFPLLRDGTISVVWQDVFDADVPLPDDTIIQVTSDFPLYDLFWVLWNGYRAVSSSGWSLDDLDKEWDSFYRVDPRKYVDYIFNASVIENIIGGEASMWGEMVDDRNVISRVWPRASAIAEKLWNRDLRPWTEASSTDMIWIPREVYHRIEEHTCRMLHRGITAEPPSGPGFCVPYNID